MTEYIVHLSQAKHNEEVANKLVQEPSCHDWGITAAFYAAIHYFECWLNNREEKHTETSIPVNTDNRFKYTAHAWRVKIIERALTKNAFKSFKKLKSASETARYLSFGPRRSPNWLKKPASDYFKYEDSKYIVEKDLANFKKELRI
jgi:hypothetical protein